MLTYRLTATLAILGTAACSGPREAAPSADHPLAAGRSVAVVDTVVPRVFLASGTAEPRRQATLSTRLMGTVTAVLAHEGDTVRNGQVLLRLDRRELAAQSARAAAGMREAEARYTEASAQVERFRALYADSAAPRAQLDAAESGYARAQAAVAAARAAQAELEAVAQYSVIRAPFSGRVTRRWVDPGTLAAPGAPLLEVEDAAWLRLRADAPPEAVAQLRRGDSVDVTVADRPVRAAVEGIVPASGNNLYRVNALVRNANGVLLSGSVGTIALPVGQHRALYVPLTTLVRQGDLVGVRLVRDGGSEIRWIRPGDTVAGWVEVLAGLAVGDSVWQPVGGAR